MSYKAEFMSKEEAHRKIDEHIGDTICFLELDEIAGFSKGNKKISKRKGKRMVDKAGTIVVFTDDPICTMNLYQAVFTESTSGSRLKGKVKTLLLAMKQESKIKNECSP